MFRFLRSGVRTPDDFRRACVVATVAICVPGVTSASDLRIAKTSPPLPTQLTHTAPPAAVELPTNFDAMVGQMIMVGFHGKSTRSAGTKRIVRMLDDGRIGGVIIMQRNLSSRKRLLDITAAFNKATGALPPFISVDQEGGAVQRLRRQQGFSRIPSASRMAARYNPSGAEKIYDRAAGQLIKAGINMNFGPVVDLNRNRRNPIIARQRRAYGTRPDKVTAYAQAFISAHRRAGVMTAAKHFPGHGSSWADSHHRFVDLTKTWKDVELAPYRNLAGADGPDMVMVGHLYHPKFSGKSGRIPASLSRTAIMGELRGRLGYSGIVITDDMEMGAVKRRFSLKERVVRSVAAGNDIILFSDAARDGRDIVDQIHAYIRAAVKSRTIPLSRIRGAYARIIAAKKRLIAPKPTVEKRSPAKQREARIQLRLTTFE